MIASLFRAGADVFRINMSHTSHDRMRELVTSIRAVEAEHGRPIGILVDLQGPKLRVGSFANGPAMFDRRRDLRARLRSGARRRDARSPAASGNLRRHRARAHAAARRRQAAAHRPGGRQEPHRHARRGRRQAVGPQGRKPARHHHPDLGAGAQGPLRPGSRARDRHRLGGAVVRAAAGRHCRGEEDHPRPRRRDGEDREAAGGDPARRHHGFDRRPDGGAWRPRRRDAAGKGAGGAETDDAQVAAHRQAGGGGDPDARIDDREPGSHPRRGFRRRDRDLRRRRRRDAVGGIGRRAISRPKRSPR